MSNLLGGLTYLLHRLEQRSWGGRLRLPVGRGKSLGVPAARLLVEEKAAAVRQDREAPGARRGGLVGEDGVETWRVSPCQKETGKRRFEANPRRPAHRRRRTALRFDERSRPARSGSRSAPVGARRRVEADPPPVPKPQDARPPAWRALSLASTPPLSPRLRGAARGRVSHSGRRRLRFEEYARPTLWRTNSCARRSAFCRASPRAISGRMSKSLRDPYWTGTSKGSRLVESASRQPCTDSDVKAGSSKAKQPQGEASAEPLRPGLSAGRRSARYERG